LGVAPVSRRAQTVCGTTHCLQPLIAVSPQPQPVCPCARASRARCADAPRPRAAPITLRRASCAEPRAVLRCSKQAAPSTTLRRAATVVRCAKQAAPSRLVEQAAPRPRAASSTLRCAQGKLPSCALSCSSDRHLHTLRWRVLSTRPICGEENVTVASSDHPLPHTHILPRCCHVVKKECVAMCRTWQCGKKNCQALSLI
jgi:hypothetical protein